MSRALIGSRDSIDAIVSASVEWNAQHGVTGMLWYDGSRFAQVLEGDAAAVSDTMERIRRDPLHTDIEIVSDRDIQVKMFADWAMMQADDSVAAAASTGFLVGYARMLTSGAGRKLCDIVLAAAG